MFFKDVCGSEANHSTALQIQSVKKAVQRFKQARWRMDD
jgi:hypothetical protein